MDDDQVRRRLGEITEELIGVADDDFPTRFRLESEQDRLRDQARSVPFDKFAHRPDDELADEARTLRGTINGLHGRTLNRAAMASADGNSGSTDGFVGGSMTALNSSVLSAGEVGRSNSRLVEVIQELERRGVDVGNAGPTGRTGG